MIAIVKLIAAGLATVFFLIGAFTHVRETWDHHTDDLAKVGRWNAAGSFFAAVVFACEVAIYFWPKL